MAPKPENQVLQDAQAQASATPEATQVLQDTQAQASVTPEATQALQEAQAQASATPEAPVADSPMTSSPVVSAPTSNEAASLPPAKRLSDVVSESDMPKFAKKYVSLKGSPLAS